LLYFILLIIYSSNLSKRINIEVYTYLYYIFCWFYNLIRNHSVFTSHNAYSMNFSCCDRLIKTEMNLEKYLSICLSKIVCWASASNYLNSNIKAAKYKYTLFKKDSVAERIIWMWQDLSM